ncbi:hypothetical protein OG426_17020 [Streptomyces canus]|uniref:hypothetical protein n=1 Tax=Streptomyces canus TaxID=58343 RepID=UPI00386530F8|nr:hypothetical protein OG426_17020 [Streptomyces canus]
MPATRLPTAAGCSLHGAGQDWDVIRVPRQLGLAAMAILGPRCGAVLEHPHKPTVYYFVPVGTAAEWESDGTTAIGEGGTLAIPPTRCTPVVGPHWLVCPGDSDWLTDARALQAALEDCSASDTGTELSA